MSEQVKCYLKRKSRKVDAWIAGGFLSRLGFGPRILNGKVTLEDGTHPLDPTLYFQVDYPTLWQRLLPFLTKRQIWGQLFKEGVDRPFDIGGEDGDDLDRSSARALKFASRIRKFAIMEQGQPQWLLMLLVGGVFLIAGFAMGKL